MDDMGRLLGRGGRLSPMITSGQGAPTADAPEMTMYFDTAATSSEALLYVRERAPGGHLVWRAIASDHQNRRTVWSMDDRCPCCGAPLAERTEVVQVDGTMVDRGIAKMWKCGRVTTTLRDRRADRPCPKGTALPT